MTTAPPAVKYPPVSVDLCGHRPAFRIRAEGQKSGQDEVLPMTPDFVEWLLATYPKTERTGRVFKLLDLQTKTPLAPRRVSVIVAKIGRKARVVRQGGKEVGRLA